MSINVTPPLVLTTAGVVEALELAELDVDAVCEAEAEPGDVVVAAVEVTVTADTVVVDVLAAEDEADAEDT